MPRGAWYSGTRAHAIGPRAAPRSRLGAVLDARACVLVLVPALVSAHGVHGAGASGAGSARARRAASMLGKIWSGAVSSSAPA